MFKESAPFKQFRLVFKLYGYIPREISSGHKTAAIIMFIQFELFYGFLLIASVLQRQENPSAFMTQAFQVPLMISFLFKALYYFWKFDEIDQFMRNMTNLFAAENNNKIFKNAMRFGKSLSTVYSAFYTFAALFPPVGVFLAKTPLVVIWKFPGVDPESFFYFHWVQESIGNAYLICIASIMDLFPFCIMIMIQGYFNFLNEKFKDAKTNRELFDSVEKFVQVKNFVAEFQRIFAPVLFMQSAALIGSFCATMLIVTTNVS